LAMSVVVVAVVVAVARSVVGMSWWRAAPAGWVLLVPRGIPGIAVCLIGLAQWCVRLRWRGGCRRFGLRWCGRHRWRGGCRRFGLRWCGRHRWRGGRRRFGLRWCGRRRGVILAGGRWNRVLANGTLIRREALIRQRCEGR
jgi:hypothetical protein